MAFKTIITCDRASCQSKFEFPHEVCNVTTEDAWRAAESEGWSGLELDFCPLHAQGSGNDTNAKLMAETKRLTEDDPYKTIPLLPIPDEDGDDDPGLGDYPEERGYAPI